MGKSIRNITFANVQRKTKCGVCNKELVFKNLKRHFRTYHGNQLVKEKAPANSVSLNNLFRSVPSSKTTTNLKQNDEHREPFLEETISDLESEVIVSESADSDVCEKIEIVSKLNVIHDMIVNLDMPKKDDLIQVVDEKFEFFLKKVKDLHVDSTSINTKSTPIQIYNEKDLDSACAAKSIDDIMDRLNNWKLHFSNETMKEKEIPDGLYCIYCSTEISESKGAIGVIHYDFLFGDNFKRSDFLPREFRNLKGKIRGHMESSYHAEKVTEKMKLDKIVRDKDFLKRNERTGLVCARNAYKAIYSNHSYLSYEVEIAKDAANKVDVGELNHSADFCSDMVDCFYGCLTSRFREQILTPLRGTGRPSPMTLIFDKYTPMHRTLNIVASNVYISGSLHTVFLDCPVVRHHNAQGLADNLSCSVEKVYGGCEWKKR